MGRLDVLQEWRRDEYVASTNPTRLDLGVVHNFLKNSYWASGVPREVVERSVESSLVFGVYKGDEQVGFARVTHRPRHLRLSGGRIHP